MLLYLNCTYSVEIFAVYCSKNENSDGDDDAKTREEILDVLSDKSLLCTVLALCVCVLFSAMTWIEARVRVAQHIKREKNIVPSKNIKKP